MKNRLLYMCMVCASLALAACSSAPADSPATSTAATSAPLFSPQEIAPADAITRSTDGRVQIYSLEDMPPVSGQPAPVVEPLPVPAPQDEIRMLKGEVDEQLLPAPVTAPNAPAMAGPVWRPNESVEIFAFEDALAMPPRSITRSLCLGQAQAVWCSLITIQQR
jgi:hypothetical protein